MKRQLLLSLTLSLLASTAFAMPASEQAVSAEAKTSAALHDTLAEGGSDRANAQHQRVADSGASHLVQQYQRVAQDGAEYVNAQHARG
ncbi:hypothetical protein [Pseudomonas sp. NA-150]|uniref:hypothetical protein n=1 Tax=Pseudomonas sp. NA-150 TaxID=3367525 RepID=UPI0037C95108